MRRRRADSKLDALSKVPLFEGFSKRHLTAVATIADEIDLPADRVLIQEDVPGREFFILLEGTVAVRRRGRKIASMGPGDFFGEIALLSPRKTTASVTTTSPVRVAVVTRAGFKRLLRENPPLQMSVITALVSRVPDE
jgi:CRP-like cAMP-binding protein